MNWMQKLYETYENCKPIVGITTDGNIIPLLPICHTTQKAQIEIAIDGNGNFRRASVISKGDSRTIIPCTEKSGGRTSGEAAHPLCDKLQYIARDYKEYGGKKAYYFNSYFEQLYTWCDSEYSHPKAKAILNYITKGNVIKDLVDAGILFCGDDGMLLENWDKKEVENIPDIFKVSANKTQDDAFVRWIVEIPGDPQSAVWTDESLYESWMNYYTATKQGHDLCYATGELLSLADQHPAKIRNDGDKAKLVSSNDATNYTYRGRFLNAEQACGVGFAVTQKAHSALRWLISRQGYRKGDLAIVAWAVSAKEIPDPMKDTYAFLGIGQENDDNSCAYTAQEFALKLKKKIAGYNAALEKNDRIIIMGLDSATPGRMSILFYKEREGTDFLERLENWHFTCNWIHDYKLTDAINPKTGKMEKIHVRFIGAPAPDDIAEAAYGARLDDKLRKATVCRIMPCIIDGQAIPRYLIESIVRRAVNRIAMEDWEWNKTLGIACALYKKYHEKENYKMALDENRKTRDYLYGRLLALADSLEQWALRETGENRQTTATRLMQRFADHPFTTWRTIELALNPYKSKLGNMSLKWQRIISEVMSQFSPEDFTSDKRLSGEFLLGYHCQRESLWKKDAEEENKEQSNNKEN